MSHWYHAQEMKNAALSRTEQSVSRFEVAKNAASPQHSQKNEAIFQPTILAKSLTDDHIHFLQKVNSKGGVVAVSQGSYDRGINWLVLTGLLQAQPLQIGPLCEPSGEVRLEMTPLAASLVPKLCAARG